MFIVALSTIARRWKQFTSRSLPSYDACFFARPSGGSLFSAATFHCSGLWHFPVAPFTVPYVWPLLTFYQPLYWASVKSRHLHCPATHEALTSFQPQHFHLSSSSCSSSFGRYCRPSFLASLSLDVPLSNSSSSLSRLCLGPYCSCAQNPSMPLHHLLNRVLLLVYFGRIFTLLRENPVLHSYHENDPQAISKVLCPPVACACTGTHLSPPLLFLLPPARRLLSPWDSEPASSPEMLEQELGTLPLGSSSSIYIIRSQCLLLYCETSGLLNCLPPLDCDSEYGNCVFLLFPWISSP